MKVGIGGSEKEEAMLDGVGCDNVDTMSKVVDSSCGSHMTIWSDRIYLIIWNSNYSLNS